MCATTTLGPPEDVPKIVPLGYLFEWQRNLSSIRLGRFYYIRRNGREASMYHTSGDLERLSSSAVRMFSPAVTVRLNCQPPYWWVLETATELNASGELRCAEDRRRAKPEMVSTLTCPQRHQLAHICSNSSPCVRIQILSSWKEKRRKEKKKQPVVTVQSRRAT